MNGMKPAITSVHSPDDRLARSVQVYCPDARPPAYELVDGLNECGYLNRFVTGYYHSPQLWNSALEPFSKGRTFLTGLRRRRIANVGTGQVVSYASYDCLIRLENRLTRSWPSCRCKVAKYRTERFDKQSADAISRLADDGLHSAIFFSDVGSVHAMAAAKQRGLRVVLSMVTGHMDEEIEILEREKTRSPRFYPVYLGDGSLDLEELRWLHDRRRRDLEQADLILVPSEHIAEQVVNRSEIPSDRVRVIPYAADIQRFRPQKKYSSAERCRFLFAGGITQRKGLSDLLEAWNHVRRPGWSLTMAGEAPRSAIDLIPKNDPTIELIGKVTYGDMPQLMSSHDVFVFPTLFEGSAVVCYEALASGLPVITTPQSGSVVRSGVDGVIVEAAEPVELASAMQWLGNEPQTRDEMSRNARERASDFTWKNYRDRVIAALGELSSVSTHKETVAAGSNP